MQKLRVCFRDCLATACVAPSLLRPRQCRYASDYWKKGPGSRKKNAHLVEEQPRLRKVAQDYQEDPRRSGQPDLFKKPGDLIPRDVLDIAWSTGFLPITTQKSVPLVAAINERGPTIDSSYIKQVSQEHDVPLSTITLLGRLLLRSTEKYDRRVGTSTLFALSLLDEEDAVIRLVSSSIKSGNLSDTIMKKPLEKLQRIAAKKHSPTAMAIAGYFAEKDGKLDQAFQWYKEVTEATIVENVTPEREFSVPRFAEDETKTQDSYFSHLEEKDQDSLDENIARAHIAFARLLLTYANPPDIEGAKRIYAFGTHLGHDPEAARNLAELEHQWTPVWLQYMHLAAESGDMVAQFQLGKFYSVPDSFITGKDPMIKQLGETKTKEAYEKTADEIWASHLFKPKDLDSLKYDSQTQEAFLLHTPPGIRTEPTRVRYAIEWFSVAYQHPYVVRAGAEHITMSFFFPAALFFLRMLPRAYPSVAERHKQFGEQVAHILSKLNEYQRVALPDLYQSEWRELQKTDWRLLLGLESR